MEGIKDIEGFEDGYEMEFWFCRDGEGWRVEAGTIEHSELIAEKSSLKDALKAVKNYIKKDTENS